MTGGVSLPAGRKGLREGGMGALRAEDKPPSASESNAGTSQPRMIKETACARIFIGHASQEQFIRVGEACGKLSLPFIPDGLVEATQFSPASRSRGTVAASSWLRLCWLARNGAGQRGCFTHHLLLQDSAQTLTGPADLYFQASRHISGYHRPSSISIRSKSVITLPSFLRPYSWIISGMNPSVSSSRQPRLLMKLL